MTDPRYRKMDLSDPVTITLPAHVWFGFCAAYVSAEWADYYATRITKEAQKQMLDPVYLKEHEAASQYAKDVGNSALSALFGRRPDIPPNMDDEQM